MSTFLLGGQGEQRLAINLQKNSLSAEWRRVTQGGPTTDLGSLPSSAMGYPQIVSIPATLPSSVKPQTVDLRELFHGEVAGVV